MMNKKELTPQVETDQKKHYLAMVIHGVVDDPDFQEIMAARISKAMEDIADRAIAADMQVLSTTVTSCGNSVVVDGGVHSYLTVSIMCYWEQVEVLKARALQAQLMGQNSQPGPRRMQ